MTASNLVLIIDAQKDFCDIPASVSGVTGEMVYPALPVMGAHADMQRLGAWLEGNAARIDDIVLTMDSHQYYDIAHPTFWRTARGGEVAPFTPIPAADMRAGRFRPADPALHERAQAYLDELEARGRYTHMVWPVHCEIGSWGHGLHPVVLESVQHWQQQRSRAVTTVFKGMHPLTEHYSALRAEVPDPADPASQLNTALVGRIADAGGQVVVAGEASTHCVAATMRDLFEVLPKEHLARFVLLTDCMSPVANFEVAHLAFLEEAALHGVRLETSRNFGL